MTKPLELASLLTNEWSLSGEVCEDMEIDENQLERITRAVWDRVIAIDKIHGKIRLGFGTTVESVRFAISNEG